MNNNNLMLIILGVVVLSLIIGAGLFFGFGTSESVLASFNKNPVATNVKVISDTNEFKIIQVDFSSSTAITTNTCKQLGDIGVNHVVESVRISPSGAISTLDGGDNIVYNYDLSEVNKNQDSEPVSTRLDFGFSPLTHCGGPAAPEGPATITNQKGVCQALSDNSLKCNLEFDVDLPRKNGMLGQVRGSFQVKLFKAGFPIVQETISTTTIENGSLVTTTIVLLEDVDIIIEELSNVGEVTSSNINEVIDTISEKTGINKEEVKAVVNSETNIDEGISLIIWILILGTLLIVILIVILLLMRRK